MKKRILTFVLSLVMILSCVTVSALAVEADNTWYGDGSATEYRIYDAADLLAFAAALKGGESFDGKTVYLCNDVVLNSGSAADWATNAPKNVYDALNSSSRFSGTFDGQGYVISGLYTSGVKDTGLIPYVRNTATIKNVTITNSYFAGTQYVSAVVAVYDADEKATFTMQNVHVVDTIINSSADRGAGILAFVYDCSATNVSVVMEDITFVGGSISAKRMSGGIIGTINNGGDYNNGVALVMNRIVLDTDLTFGISANFDVKSGSLIGNIAGFRSIDITNVFVGGSLTILVDANNYYRSTAILFGYLKTQNSNGSNINVTNALLAQTCTNVRAVLYCKGDTSEESAILKFENVYYDTDVVDASKGCNRVEQNPMDSDEIPETTGKSFATLKGTNAGYTGWIAVKDSYPVPTARPARLLGYQSSYATDVTDDNNANETYSIRLIAALNDTFYTYAGFENITITYTDSNGQPVNVPKENYFCKYAYTSVIGTDKSGATQTYTASDYGADSLIALVITGIPENVTEFTVTVNPFAGNGDVSFAGLTKTVQISAQ